MRSSKYLKPLGCLLKKPFFTTADAEKLGVTSQALAYFVKKGILERIYPGTFRSPHYESQVDFEWENLALAASAIPQGVICLISALCYYDLTDQIMREAWIAIPHKLRSYKRSNVRLVRMRNLELGKEKITLGEYTVQIFDRERCIIDAFRYLGVEIAIKALQSYLRNTDYKPKLKKLSDYAKILRVNIAPYILAYTT